MERIAKDKSEFRIEKIMRNKGDKLYVNWKGYDNSFNSWIDKKYIIITLWEISYYPEPDSHSRNNIKFEIDLSNYATNSEVLKAAGVDTPDFAKKADLTGLKSGVDKLDVDKLKLLQLI